MLKLVCFGDSITAGTQGLSKPMLTTKLAEHLKEFEIINAGVSGDNTCDAMSRIQNDVMKHNPDLVTVLFGANDAAFHKMVDIETYKENLYKIIEHIGSDKAILISPAPVDEKLQFDRTNNVLSEYSLIVQEAARDTGSYFIDFFSEFISIDNYQEKLIGLENDGLHFGEKGYDILVRLMVSKIKEIHN
ncbi:SGNH/GDSL hydrolase family protein [Halobacillus sp. A1]|uniref:SGNH/GDSL hydrolase family protein n=1 Tax=Halobacillus sp. A1 TaxID=2880262 RepID=UPI0020A65E32|nr:SGNH/GDSL hydrolase family protein [Halobacillus sp. A1]MCP3031530.1 SGNH/GDSL hydrolase family protein [Halobacillus sp. A1]